MPLREPKGFGCDSQPPLHLDGAFGIGAAGGGRKSCARRVPLIGRLSRGIGGDHRGAAPIGPRSARWSGATDLPFVAFMRVGVGRDDDQPDGTPLADAKRRGGRTRRMQPEGGLPLGVRGNTVALPQLDHDPPVGLVLIATRSVRAGWASAATMTSRTAPHWHGR